MQTPRQAAGVNVRTIRGLRLAGSSRSAFSSHAPMLGGFSETGANLGGLKHQSAQCPSRHYAMNRRAKKTPPNAARPQVRKAACGVAQRRTGWSASWSARPSAACTSPRFIRSFAPHGRTLNRFQKWAGLKKSALALRPALRSLANGHGGTQGEQGPLPL